MGNSELIVIVMIAIPSMSFIFLFTILKTQKVTKKKIEKIFGKENILKVIEAKTEEEIKKDFKTYAFEKPNLEQYYTFENSEGKAFEDLSNNKRTLTITGTNYSDTTSFINTSTAWYHYKTLEDTPITIIAGYSPIGNITITANPTKGTIKDNNNGSFTYTPQTDSDTSYNLTYTVTDKNNKTANRIINIGITPINDGPKTKSKIEYSTNETTKIQLNILNILDKIYDPEGDLFSFVAIDNFSQKGALISPNGELQFEYNPNTSKQITALKENETLTDTFYIYFQDDNSTSSKIPITIHITGENNAPVAISDSFNTQGNTTSIFDILKNDKDSENDELFPTITQNPKHATAIINADKTVTFTTKNNYYGKDLFKYKISDGNKTSKEVEVIVSITRKKLSSKCTQNNDCRSGFCIDGVCCETICGNGIEEDCIACSKSKGGETDGKCTAIINKNHICRSAKNQCDIPEICDGKHKECPPDLGASQGTNCDDGLFCNGIDTCDGHGKCKHTGNPCKNKPECQKQCNESNATCQNDDGSICNDNLSWTQNDECQSGKCQGEEIKGNCEQPYKVKHFPFLLKTELSKRKSHINKYGKKCEEKKLISGDIVLLIETHNNQKYKIRAEGIQGADPIIIVSNQCKEEETCEQFANQTGKNEAETIEIKGNGESQFIIIESLSKGIINLKISSNINPEKSDSDEIIDDQDSTTQDFDENYKNNTGGCSITQW